MSGLAVLAAVSYSIPGAVVATGIGETTIRKALNDGDLVAHYVGSKPVIRAADLDEWVESLPTEKPERASA